MTQNSDEEKPFFVTKEMRPEVLEVLAVKSWDSKHLQYLQKLITQEESGIDLDSRQLFK